LANILKEIELVKGNLNDLVKLLDDHIKVADEYRGSWEPDHVDYLNSYFTKPEQEYKNDPWPGASNTYLPLIRVGIDGLLAQFYDTLLSQLPFIKVRGLNDAARDASEDLSVYYGEFFLTKQINFREYGGNFLFDLLVDGTAVGKGRVNREEMLRRRLREVPKKTSPLQRVIPAVQTFLGQPLTPNPSNSQTGSVEFREETYIEEKRSVELENTDLTQIYIPPYAGSSLQFPECPWYYEKHHLSWNDLLSRKRMGYNVDDGLKVHLGLRPPTEKDAEIADEFGTSIGNPGEPTIEVLEFYMRIALPATIKHSIRAAKVSKLKGAEKQKFMDEEGWEEEVVVTYLPKAKEIIRIVPLDRVRSDGKRPHIDGRYHRIPRSFYGSGVPESRMGLQVAINSFFNQMVDYGTLQNLPWAFFSPNIVGDLPERMFLEPGALIPTSDPGSVNFPRFQGDAGFWISAIQMIQAWFERAESVSDFTRGISPDRPNAPETARATLALIANAQLAFDWKSAEIAEYLTEAVRHVHELHVQYLDDAVDFEFFNRESRAFDRRTIPKSVFKEPVEFQFILNPSRQSEQQVNQLLFSLLSEVIVQAAGGNIQVLRPMAKDLWTSHGKDNFNDVWPEATAPQIDSATGQPAVDPNTGQPIQVTQPNAPPTPPVPQNGEQPSFTDQLAQSLDQLSEREGGPFLTGEEESVKIPK